MINNYFAQAFPEYNLFTSQRDIIKDGGVTDSLQKKEYKFLLKKNLQILRIFISLYVNTRKL